MPRTTQCKSCGTILNLPANVTAGKKLRCPKCGLKFAVTVADAMSESTLAAPLDADPSRTGLDIVSVPSSPDDLPVPVSDKDLRETFDLPLISAREAERQGASSTNAVGDATALFQDPVEPRRRGAGGDVRSQARRCSHCGGLVPQGMSICVTCGTDQETGVRVGLDGDLAPPPPPPPTGPPLHITIIGGLLGVAALILLVLSLVKSVAPSESWQNYGWLCLALVSGFGIYAVVQFIRLKSTKLLMAALTLGVIINVMTLVAMPLILPYIRDPAEIATPNRTDNPEEADILIKSPEELMDLQTFKLGITFLVIYAILAVYLMSPAVKKPLHRANASVSW